MKLIGKLLYFISLLLVSCNGAKIDGPIEKGTVEDIDGNIYKTIKVGDLWWMAENLRVTKYNNGSSVYNQLNTDFYRGDSLGIYTAYNRGNDYILYYGLLYNWLAVADERGLCPTGWRVPSDKDWKNLEMNTLKISKKELNDYGWRGKGAGVLKDTDSLAWRQPNIDANNLLGFNARAGGCASFNKFEHLHNIGYWWTSKVYREEEMPHRPKTAYFRELYFYNDKIGRSYKPTYYALSVRCVREE